MTLLRYALATFLALVAVPGAAQEDIAEFGTGTTEMTLMSTTDIAIIAPVMQRFADAHDVRENAVAGPEQAGGEGRDFRIRRKPRRGPQKMQGRAAA